MKLSFVTANLGSGGAERVTSLLANQFCQKGYDVEIIFFRNRLIFYELDSRIKVVVIEEECYSNAMWRKVLWLRSYVKKTRPDVVIPFRVSVYCTTILSLLGVSVSIVASERIDPRIPDSYWTLLRRLLLPFVSHLVVQTNYIKSYYPKFIQKKTTVIPNPVNDEVFSLPQSSLKGRGEERINRIISVGRLYPQKNQEMMIRAFAKVADVFPDWQLVIYGEGPLRESLELIVDSLEMKDRILLPGRTEHVIDELRKSKIFCLSSDYEGMSNSMLEAICLGLPVVSTKVSGTEDLLKNGVNGYLVNKDDIESLATIFRRLVPDAELMDKMSLHNLTLSKQFRIDAVVNQWNSLLLKVAK